MRRIRSLIISLLLLLTAVVSYLCVKSEAEQPVAFGDGYAVIRLFDKDGFTPLEISNIRYAAEEASIEDVDDNGRLWCDAYSYFTEAYVSRDDREGINCHAIVTGGDFFLFRHLKFKKGWYYTDTDLHLDRVVIDERLAFELYGSNDVEDMTLTINGKTLYVSGVVAIDESKARMMQSEALIIYIPQHLAEGLFGERSFENYEIMLQNPVDSYALTALSTVTEGREAVDVTGRFEIKNTFRLLREFPTRSYRTDSVIYPYWENQERGIEDILVLLLTVNAVMLVIVLINAIIFIIERKKQ